MFIIKWTNKFSNEVGYVGSVSTKNQCFYNASREDAKSYSNEKQVKKTLTMLTKYGEAENNIFESVEV